MKCKMKCIVCGEKGYIHKLPHGEICFCHKLECLRRFLAVTERSVPVLWVGDMDIDEHSKIPSEKMTTENLLNIAGVADSYLWNDDMFAEQFSDAVNYAVLQEEKKKVLSSSKEDLPLMINEIVYEENRAALEQRLRDG